MRFEIDVDRLSTTQIRSHSVGAWFETLGAVYQYIKNTI